MKIASLRTKKGVIELELTVEAEQISYIKITGDFFVYPEEALEKLEQLLVGKTIDKQLLLSTINHFYKEHKISSPGITPEDWVEVIIKAST
jgi:hypothetical protein